MLFDRSNYVHCVEAVTANPSIHRPRRQPSVKGGGDRHAHYGGLRQQALISVRRNVMGS